MTLLLKDLLHLDIFCQKDPIRINIFHRVGSVLRNYGSATLNKEFLSGSSAQRHNRIRIPIAHQAGSWSATLNKEFLSGSSAQRHNRIRIPIAHQAGSGSATLNKGLSRGSIAQRHNRIRIPINHQNRIRISNTMGTHNTDKYVKSSQVDQSLSNKSNRVIYQRQTSSAAGTFVKNNQTFLSPLALPFMKFANYRQTSLGCINNSYLLYFYITILHIIQIPRNTRQCLWYNWIFSEG